MKLFFVESFSNQFAKHPMYKTKSMVHYATSMRLRFVYYRDTTVKKNMQNMIGVKFTLFAVNLYKMYKKFAPKILKSIKFGENMS